MTEQALRARAAGNAAETDRLFAEGQRADPGTVAEVPLIALRPKDPSHPRLTVCNSRDLTGSYDDGLLEQAAMATLAAVIVVVLGHDVRHRRAVTASSLPEG